VLTGKHESNQERSCWQSFDERPTRIGESPCGFQSSKLKRDLLTSLDPTLRDDLTLAFYRTSVNMTRKLSETTESGFGLDEASIGAASLKATLKTSLAYKKAATRNQELTFLGYDDKAAEQDIIRISKMLANGYQKAQTRSRQFLNWLQRKRVMKTSLKIVFVFDELDKLESIRSSKKVGTINRWTRFWGL
jgi:hypothetical protein